MREMPANTCATPLLPDFPASPENVTSWKRPSGVAFQPFIHGVRCATALTFIA